MQVAESQEDIFLKMEAETQRKKNPDSFIILSVGSEFNYRHALRQ